MTMRPALGGRPRPRIPNEKRSLPVLADRGSRVAQLGVSYGALVGATSGLTSPDELAEQVAEGPSPPHMDRARARGKRTRRHARATGEADATLTERHVAALEDLDYHPALFSISDELSSDPRLG